MGLTFTTRSGKGSELTHNEMDANWTQISTNVGKTSFATSGPSSGNAQNDIFWDTSTGKMYVYYIDADSTGQWVQVR